MATLKDHQQAMVDLLASGSGIPASASRLAHAMHDVLSAILSEPDPIAKAVQESKTIRMAYTTPGLNDKALAGDIDRFMSKPDLLARAREAERRVKELENTVKQLRASNAKLRQEKAMLELTGLSEDMGLYDAPEQAGCRKTAHEASCLRLIRELLPEQAGCRKDDTQVCEHTSWEDKGCGVRSCCDCGALI